MDLEASEDDLKNLEAKKELKNSVELREKKELKAAEEEELNNL